jgi:predicted permease
MTSYAELLKITLPVFALFALGLVLRRIGWMKREAEESILKLILNLFYPCLIFKSVLGNTALREPGNLFSAPLAGFGTLVLGMAAGYYLGRLLGLSLGTGLRSFAFSVGIYNYGYIPIPLVDELWGKETLGVLLVHNVGVEFGIWTVGILMLAGLSPRDGWKKLANPVVLSLVAGLLLNTLQVALPPVTVRLVDVLAGCAIPLGLLASGAALNEFLGKPSDLYDARVSLGGIVLRLGLLPLAFLALAKWAPVSTELKHVLVVEAAMPAGMLPLVIARYYGGQPLVVAQVILSTTLVGIALIPLWIRLGLLWVG